jgi:hypothetical protein
VGSDEFLSTFVQHELPVVANISSVLIRIQEKEIGLEEMNKLLLSLKEEQQRQLKILEERYNLISPGS